MVGGDGGGKYFIEFVTIVLYCGNRIETVVVHTQYNTLYVL